MTPPRALLIDFDDTLYDYAPAVERARRALVPRIAEDEGLAPEEIAVRFDAARGRVKARVGARGSSHSRLLYLHELAHDIGGGAVLAKVRAWERLFWKTYMETATLRPYARELLCGFRARGGKIAIVTDLVLETQLMKLEAFGLASLVDAMAVSEEVPFDKPEVAIFELAIRRLGVATSSCVVLGDDPKKDGGGARALGIPFHHVVSSEHPERGGATLEAIAEELWR